LIPESDPFSIIEAGEASSIAEQVMAKKAKKAKAAPKPKAKAKAKAKKK